MLVVLDPKYCGHCLGEIIVSSADHATDKSRAPYIALRRPTEKILEKLESLCKFVDHGNI